MHPTTGDLYIADDAGHVFQITNPSAAPVLSWLYTAGYPLISISVSAAGEVFLATSSANKRLLKVRIPRAKFPAAAFCTVKCGVGDPPLLQGLQGGLLCTVRCSSPPHIMWRGTCLRQMVPPRLASPWTGLAHTCMLQARWALHFYISFCINQ